MLLRKAVVLFVLAALVFAGQAQAEQKPIEDYWAETGLKLDNIKIRVIVNSNCNKALIFARGCVSALDTLARFGQPMRGFFPKSMVQEYADRIVKVEELDLGDFVLAQIKPVSAPKPMPSLYQRYSQQKQDLTRLYAAYDQVTVSGTVDFEKLLDQITPLVLNPKLESFQTATAINEFFSFAEAHASLVPRKKMEDQTKTAGTTQFVGIGVELAHINSKYIIKPQRGGPAAKAKLITNDAIVKVDGFGVSDLTMGQLVEKLRGKAGSRVKLLIEREGRPAFETSIVRGAIKVGNVESSPVEDGRRRLGYMRLHSFLNKSSCKDVRTAILKHQKAKAQGLILDLRENSGGSTAEAACIAGLFVGKKLIMRQRVLDHVKAMSGGILKDEDLVSPVDKITDLPLVVVIDASSGSASEIVAGSLQDEKRAWILGERSFGKGSVLSPIGYDHPNPAVAEIWILSMIARFHFVSGRTNQIVGISPDFTVPFKPGATEEERFRLREAEAMPNALHALGEAWQQPRPEQVAQIEACVMEKGVALQKYEDSRRRSQIFDYQIQYAADVLNCQ
ncbi:MAG: S41 family peptidase [Bdellovibrionales bacterium]